MTFFSKNQGSLPKVHKVLDLMILFVINTKFMEINGFCLLGRCCHNYSNKNVFIAKHLCTLPGGSMIRELCLRYAMIVYSVL